MEYYKKVGELVVEGVGYRHSGRSLLCGRVCLSWLQHYDIDIIDHKQPLIVSNPKAREVRARGGDSSPILLVPELCTRTGM